MLGRERGGLMRLLAIALPLSLIIAWLAGFALFSPRDAWLLAVLAIIVVPVDLAPAVAMAAPPVQRVLALATPEPRSRTTVYHAFRTAERLHAPVDVLWVRTDAAEVPEDENVAALRRLVSTLGGNLIVSAGTDIVQAAARVARERGSTYLLIGQPGRRRAVGRSAHRKLPLRLMATLPGVDLQIVALADVPA